MILINFIEEERLLAADALVKGLTKEEEDQNKLGPMLIFRHQKARTHPAQTVAPKQDHAIACPRD